MFVFVAVILIALVGMAALVVDAGSWYQGGAEAADRGRRCGARRRAGACRSMPRRGGDYESEEVRATELPRYAGAARTFPDAATIDVVAEADTPGIFAPVIAAAAGSAFDDVAVRAEAQAGVSAPHKLKKVAPIGLYKDMACIVSNPGCFGQTLTIDFDGRR